MGIGKQFKSTIKQPFDLEWTEAVRWGDVDRVRRYLAHGSDVNQNMSTTGFLSSLHVALMGKNPEMTRLLLDSRAVIDAVAKKYAKEWGNPEIVQLLNDTLARRVREESAPLPVTWVGKDILSIAIESGDCGRVRTVFDEAFWEGRRIVPEWEHLKIALLREDKPMMRLLVTWGAKAPENAEQLAGIPADKYTVYARILRVYGLDATVVETAVKTASQLIPEDEPTVAQEAPARLTLDKKLPAEWLQVLRAFQIEALEAVIAGGALRDTFNGKPVKDVDIFLKTRGSEKKNRRFLENVFKAMNIKIAARYVDVYNIAEERRPIVLEKQGVWPMQTRVMESWKVIAGPQKTKYNIIFVDGTLAQTSKAEFATQLINRFDFGFCQIAYNGETFITTPAFKGDVVAKRISQVVENPSSVEHLQRLVKKYPDWELDVVLKTAATKPGSLVSDGSVYLGEHNGKDWFVADRDAREATGRKLRLDFNAAARFAQETRVHGHNDWVVPDVDILNEMYKMRDKGAFKGTFDAGYDLHTSWYWASTRVGNSSAYELGFSIGLYYSLGCSDEMALRCVRAVPVKKKTGINSTGPK